jgi:N-acylneuraminate cytidylyltransferase
MTTVAYVSRPEFILKASSIWDGSVVGVEIPRERSIDIDNALDFAIAQFLMEQHELL